MQRSRLPCAVHERATGKLEHSATDLHLCPNFYPHLLILSQREPSVDSIFCYLPVKVSLRANCRHLPSVVIASRIIPSPVCITCQILQKFKELRRLADEEPIVRQS